MTDPRERFPWHPEPELIGYGDAAASRAAMERLGADTWAAALDFLYDKAANRAMGDPAPYAALRAKFFGASGGPAPAPVAPAPIAIDPRRVPRSARGWPDERAAPAPVRLLHAAAVAGLDDGRAAGPDDQPGRRRLACRPAGDLRRGGGRALAVRPGRLRPGVVRAADLGRRDGQLHGHDAGPRHPPRAPAGCRAGAARGAARGRPRLHLGPDPFLDRPGARPARLPARDARGHPVGRPVPAARRAGRGGRRPRPRGRA